MPKATTCPCSSCTGNPNAKIAGCPECVGEGYPYADRDKACLTCSGYGIVPVQDTATVA